MRHAQMSLGQRQRTWEIHVVVTNVVDAEEIHVGQVQQDKEPYYHSSRGRISHEADARAKGLSAARQWGRNWDPHSAVQQKLGIPIGFVKGPIPIRGLLALQIAKAVPLATLARA